ncbi:MAG TPA: L-serine ammonia-lyase, iron-sulfur-dependent, subunit alpha, partial [Candidatus Limnocylindria bacterium]|nr:L-serine ammonia-lyase, iron-sulfur-dependent, subunit alpha [Candidatus Limnocylindria bacterium]
MPFRNIQELVALAQEGGKPISRVMLEQETQESGRPEADILAEMEASLRVMRAAAARGMEGVRSHSGMTGGNARKLRDYAAAGHGIAGETFLRALTYAVGVNEVNAGMGLVCATPTAGSCGVLPGVLLAAGEKLGKGDADLVAALFCAGAVGYVIANNALIAGAAGGCQAEVGSASAMAAAALVEL